MNQDVAEFHFTLLHVLANRGYSFDEDFANSLETKSLAELTEILEMCYGDEAFMILHESAALLSK